jgi:hypothetical protein
VGSWNCFRVEGGGPEARLVTRGRYLGACSPRAMASECDETFSGLLDGVSGNEFIIFTVIAGIVLDKIA